MTKVLKKEKLVWWSVNLIGKQKAQKNISKLENNFTAKTKIKKMIKNQRKKKQKLQKLTVQKEKRKKRKKEVKKRKKNLY